MVDLVWRSRTICPIPRKRLGAEHLDGYRAFFSFAFLDAAKGRQKRGQKLACELLYIQRSSSFRLRVFDLLFSCILPFIPSGQRRVNMVFAQLDAIRYYEPPFSVAKPIRNRSLARKSGFPNTQSKDDASRTSKSCTNDSVRVDGYDVIECLDLTESPPSITLQGQAGALVRAKPAVGKSHPKT